MHRIE
jgi:hypothetical protein